MEILGNESQIRYQNEVGEHEFKWMRRYGTAWRRTGTLGVSLLQRLADVSADARASLKVDHLSLVDPKALQYVLHTSGYHFPKGKEVTQAIKLVIGQGVVWAHGLQIFELPASMPLTYTSRHDPSTPEENHDAGILCSPTQNLPSLIPRYGVEG